MESEIGEAALVRTQQGLPRGEIVRQRRLEQVDGFCGIVAVEFNCGASDREIVIYVQGGVGTFLGDFASQGISASGISGASENIGREQADTAGGIQSEGGGDVFFGGSGVACGGLDKGEVKEHCGGGFFLAGGGKSGHAALS